MIDIESTIFAQQIAFGLTFLLSLYSLYLNYQQAKVKNQMERLIILQRGNNVLLESISDELKIFVAERSRGGIK